MINKAHLDLFDEVKNHVSNNLTDENVPLLSSIAKATDGVHKYDFHSVDDALCLIQKHFHDTGKHSDERLEIFRTFGVRLIVENAEQLTATYNRILQNVRTFFPELNIAQASHNHVFGSDAMVSCFLTKCNDDELDIFAHRFAQDAHLRSGYYVPIDEIVEEMEEFYTTNFVDTIVAKAQHQGSGNGIKLLSNGIVSMLNYELYTGKEYFKLNEFLRSVKTSSSPVTSMVEVFNEFAQTFLLPFYTQKDFVIYRGDGISASAQTLTTRGLYSGSLAVSNIGHFVKNGGRVIKINIPKGTPFLPILIVRVDEGEISLLPGTVLEKQTELQFATGHFSEYKVVQNPPKFTEEQEATIFKHALPGLFKDYLSDRPSILAKNLKKWRKELPPSEGVAPFDDTVRFAINLINSYYGGDW